MGISSKSNYDKYNTIDHNETLASINFTTRKQKKTFNKKLGIVILLLVIALFSFVFINKDNSQITGGISSFEGISNIEFKEPLGSEEEIAEARNLESEFYQELLLEEANNQDIEINDKEIDNYIEDTLKKYEISEQEFNQQLQDSDLTLQEFKEKLQSTLVISELLNQNVDLLSVEVSNEEVDDFIDENSQGFQDIIEDEDTIDILKQQVKFKLLADKQTDLVLDYIDTLQ